MFKNKDLSPDEVDYVIYHDPCPDGFGSRYAAEKYLSTKFPDRKVIYCGASNSKRGQPPLDLAGKNVLICDYSYNTDVIIDLLTKVNKLLIIDHHPTAEKDLKDISHQNKVFDMKHSGAWLTWVYFFGEERIPKLILHVEARDIWIKSFPQTEEFFAYFNTLPLEYSTYEKYSDDDTLMEMINTHGKDYYDVNNSFIEKSCKYSTVKFTKIKDEFYFIAYVNSSVLKSDIGSRLFDKYPNIDFSAVYTISDWNNSTAFSLRSTNKHVDVSEIAKKFGGGGHRNASGVNMDYVTNILGKALDSGQLYDSLKDVYEEEQIIGKTKYNIVYMHSIIYKRNLGKYLLQDKYAGKQISSIILNNNKRYNISVVWNYNPLKNETKFVFNFDGLIDEQIQDICLNTKLDSQHRLILPGCVKLI